MVRITGTGTITQKAFAEYSHSLPEIVFGDKFHFDVTYDDTYTDESTHVVNAGIFSNAIVYFDMIADNNNVGSWIPGTGPYSRTYVRTYTSQEGPGRLGLQADAFDPQFAPAGAIPFKVAAIVLDYPNTTWVDTGTGQTLFDQLGGVPPPAVIAPTSFLVLAFGTTGRYAEASGPLSNVSIAVPEASSLSMLALAAAGSIACAFQKRRGRARRDMREV